MASRGQKRRRRKARNVQRRLDQRVAKLDAEAPWQGLSYDSLSLLDDLTREAVEDMMAASPSRAALARGEDVLGTFTVEVTPELMERITPREQAFVEFAGAVLNDGTAPTVDCPHLWSKRFGNEWMMQYDGATCDRSWFRVCRLCRFVETRTTDPCEEAP
jgi:hypothetical protein